MRVLVGGATGYLGGHVVRALHAAGMQVRAMGRHPDKLGELKAFCEDVVKCDATEPEPLKGVCEGVDAVFSSIGVHHVKRRPTVMQIDRDANLNLVREAGRAGVKRFAFISIIDGPNMRRRVNSAEARESVVDALRETAMQVDIIRPTGFFNDMQEFYDMAKKGRVWLIGDRHARMNCIHGADLADRVRKLLQSEPEKFRETDVGGPKIYSWQEMAELACKAAGKPTKISTVPAWLVRALALFIRPFNLNLATLMRMLAYLAGADHVAPQHGTHTLEDFYAELGGKA